MSSPQIAFPNLQGHSYANLTTFRKSGIPVTTPIWFAAEHNALYVVTEGHSGKVKRIRHTPRVQIGPGTSSGKLLGAVVEATARVLPESQFPLALQALRQKYGWQLKIFELFVSAHKSWG